MLLNRLLSLMISLMFTMTAHAKLFPNGCEVKGFGYSGPYLIVNDTGKQSFYLVQNFGADKIELERIANEEAFMAPSLRVQLDNGQWAGFASDIQGLPFQCTRIEGENATKVNCRDVLEVCQYPRVKFALSNMGNYWVSVNKPQGSVIHDAAAQGIYLRW